MSIDRWVLITLGLGMLSTLVIVSSIPKSTMSSGVTMDDSSTYGTLSSRSIDLAFLMSRLLTMFQTISCVQVVPHLGKVETQTSSGLTDSSVSLFSSRIKQRGNT